MLQSQKVSAGKYYVNTARNITREVLEIKDDSMIFITYHLDTGASTGIPSSCMKQHFTHWADHEATQTEIVNLRQLKKTNAVIRVITQTKTGEFPRPLAYSL